VTGYKRTLNRPRKPKTYYKYRTLTAHFAVSPPSMSAANDSAPAQETAPPSIDTQQLQQLQHNPDSQQNQSSAQSTSAGSTDAARKRKVQCFNTTVVRSSDPLTHSAKAPSVRRACVACHTGKTRCSEVLPCQVCIHTKSVLRFDDGNQYSELPEAWLRCNLCLS
jgi:hypothetical protein